MPIHTRIGGCLRRVFVFVRNILAIVGLTTVIVAWYLIPSVDPLYLTLDCRDDPCIIRYNPGGSVLLYRAAAYQARTGNVKVIVDGSCLSACALLADYARPNVCITERAVFGFHKTTDMLNGFRSDPSHKRDIAKWVYDHGGYPEEDLLRMRYPEAKKFWPTCI